MFSRKFFATALAVTAFGLAEAASIGAHVTANHTMYLTFNRPVGLPGVTLGSGTYIFEIPESSSHNMVRVLSRDRSIVYLTTFTSTVNRPVGMNGDQVISFREAAAGGVQPISVWWPDQLAGRQFVY